MKFRVRGSSLRLRLTRPEIADLVSKGFLENQIQLGAEAGCAFVYRVESVVVSKVAVTYQGNQLCVRVPAHEAIAWAQSEQVGIYSQESWGLMLAIEKDFKCLAPRPGEDDSEAFDNPHGPDHAACAASSL
jgi:hypothetical protein